MSEPHPPLPQGWHLVLLCQHQGTSPPHPAWFAQLPEPVHALGVESDAPPAAWLMPYQTLLLPPDEKGQDLSARLQWWSRLAGLLSEWQQREPPGTLVVAAPPVTLQALARLCLGLPLHEPDPFWLPPGALLHLVYQPQHDRWLILQLRPPQA